MIASGPVRADSDRAQVAWVTLEPPDVTGGGGGRRQAFLIEQLQRFMDVHLLMADPDRELRAPIWHHARTKLAGPEAAPILRTTPFAIHTLNYMAKNRITTAVIPHVETAATLKGVFAESQHRTIVDLHNIYSRYYDTLGSRASAARWRRLERWVCHASSAVSVLSVEEEAVVRTYHARRLSVVPNGVDMNEWPEQPINHGREGLAFFASWSHTPNQLGLTWFLGNVWPLVRARRPTATLHLYGTGHAHTGDAPSVVVHGRVERLSHALSTNLGIIVPIVRGVGTRVKFIEALASGLPVVSTSLGAQGYALPSRMFLTADTTSAFADACVRLLDQDPEVRHMAVRSRQYVSRLYSWREIGSDFADLVQSVNDYNPTHRLGDGS